MGALWTGDGREYETPGADRQGDVVKDIEEFLREQA